MTWSLLRSTITLSILVVLTLAQKNCDLDTDCLGNQYCYAASQLCANFTNCSWYNRRESTAGPARSAEQCGECIAGYIAEATLDGQANNCVKNSADSGNISDNNHTNAWIIGVVVTLICIAGMFFIAYMCWYDKVHCVRPCNNKEDQQPEKTTSASVLPMNKMLPRASAPPPSPNKNNNRYKDLEDNAQSNKNLISKIGECDRGDDCATSISRPVKAQPFNQPHWVHPAPDYTGDEENQLNAVTENDEETMSSDWTPEQSNPISRRPFGVITEEQEAVDNNGDNNTINETHDRLEAAGSLPALTSNRQEERDNWENNASGNSRNPRGNSNSFTINMQIFQTVNNGDGNGS